MLTISLTVCLLTTFYTAPQVEAISASGIWNTVKDISKRILLIPSHVDVHLLPTHNVTRNFTVHTCRDTIPNCHQYGFHNCYKYMPWALQRCAEYCEFCKNPLTVTKPPLPCFDYQPNCDSYNNDTCSNPLYREWAYTNCRKYCDLCHQTTHEHFTMTTPPSTTTGTTNANCHDNIPNCASFGRIACTKYKPWATQRCPAYCYFCGSPPPSTTPPPCVDKLDNCAHFQKDTCSNPLFKHWAEVNCRAYCNVCDRTPSAIPFTTTTSTPPTTRTTPGPYHGHGVTGPTGEFLCIQEGKTYRKGASWRKGCSKDCTCINAEFNNIRCSDTCPTWNLPSYCKVFHVSGQCCPAYSCKSD